jgi:uncharacterized protein DUF4158
VPDKVRAAPPAAVARLAERLGLDPAVLAGYGQRAHTRSDHVRLAAGYLGWKSAPADSAAMKDLEQFLLDRAMEHHSPGLLFTVAAEYRISAKTIRPGMVTPSLRRKTHHLPARTAAQPPLRCLHTPGYQRPIHLSTDRSQPSRHPHLPRTTRCGRRDGFSIRQRFSRTRVA